jgi:hypothetical protein
MALPLAQTEDYEAGKERGKGCAEDDKSQEPSLLRHQDHAQLCHEHEWCPNQDSLNRRRETSPIEVLVLSCGEVTLVQDKPEVGAHEAPAELELDVVVQLDVMLGLLFLMAEQYDGFCPLFWDRVPHQVPEIDRNR